MVEDELDLDSRELCSDGTCTGVLGDDGRCKVCGQSQAGEPVPNEPQADWKGAPGDRDEFDQRELCPDGACTGLLGPDRLCKVCGKSS